MRLQQSERNRKVAGEVCVGVHTQSELFHNVTRADNLKEPERAQQ